MKVFYHQLRVLINNNGGIVVRHPHTSTSAYSGPGGLEYYEFCVIRTLQRISVGM